jgi:hypothetical protein
MFNKLTTLMRNEVNLPYIQLELGSVWVAESNMTDQEKRENPNFAATKGYTKKYNNTYKEAWAKAWPNVSQSDKNLIIENEYFDAAVFEEITGIRV